MVHIDMLCLYWLLDIMFNKPLHVIFFLHNNHITINQYIVYVFPCDWKCVSSITPAWPDQSPNKGVR